MNKVLGDLLTKSCLCYCDDILVHSATLEEHLDDIDEVLDKLEEAGLKLKASKCKFAADSVKYLGHIITVKGVFPNPEKIAVVENYPVPQNPTHVRQFMGLVNYYRRFVKGLSTIARPRRTWPRRTCPGFGRNSASQHLSSSNQNSSHHHAWHMRTPANHSYWRRMRQVWRSHSYYRRSQTMALSMLLSTVGAHCARENATTASLTWKHWPNLQANVSATIRLFGGDSSHTPFFDWQRFQDNTLYPLAIIHMEHINVLDFDDKSERNLCFFFGNSGIIFNGASAQLFPPREKW